MELFDGGGGAAYNKNLYPIKLIQESINRIIQNKHQNQNHWVEQNLYT